MSNCKECDYTLTPTMKFCQRCGTPVTSSIATAAPVNERQVITVDSTEESVETPSDVKVEEEQRAALAIQQEKERELAEQEATRTSQEIARLSAERSRILEESDALSRRINEERARIEALQKWATKNSNSFLWRTFNAMTDHLDRARATLASYRQRVESLKVPSAGEMHELRKRFHRRLLFWFTLVPALMYFFLSIPRILRSEIVLDSPGLYSFFNALYVNDQRYIYAIGISILLLALLISLISYYRGWSRYQYRVLTLLWEMETVAANAEHVRAEEMRLTTTYPQVREWLEIIGHSLNTPWKVNPSWLTSKIETMEKESLPYSLHVAQVSLDDETAMLAMQRSASEKFMSRGWRSKVFADQIDVIREQMGLPRERLNVDQLDADIAFSPNGPRAIVSSQISNPDVLERVARRQVVPLALQVQRDTMSTLKPSVTEVRRGQVNALRKDSDEQVSDGIAWDDFLKMPLGDDRKMVTPMGVHALSDSGQVSGHQQRVESFVIAPQRLISAIANVKDQNIRTYDASLDLPMEIVVRLDFSGPIADEDVRMLWRREEPTPAPRERKPRRSDEGI